MKSSNKYESEKKKVYKEEWEYKKFSLLYHQYLHNILIPNLPYLSHYVTRML